MEQPNKNSFEARINKILPQSIDGLAFSEEYNITAETFSFFEDMLESKGFKQFKNVTEAYKEIPDDPLIVRREDPRKVMELLNEPGHYEINFEKDRYSNCVEWRPHSDGTKGIHNAYMEGMTNLNAVVTVIGFRRSDGQDIVQLPDATKNFHGLERDKVRSFKGEVSFDDVVVINLRVPGHLLPEYKLTDDELEKVDDYLDAKERGLPGNPVMVHRSFTRNNTTEYTH